jgi:hypothetical protein
VTTPDQKADDISVLFEGVITRVNPSWTGGDRTNEEVTLIADHVSSLLHDMPSMRIVGQQYSVTEGEGDEATEVRKAVAAEAAIGNPKQKYNRRLSLHSEPIGTDSEGNPINRSGPVFESPSASSSGRNYWNYAALLHYVLTWAGSLQPWFDFTAVLADLTKLLNVFSVDQLTAADPAWAAPMIRSEANVAIEGCSLLEAIALICDKAGIGFSLISRFDQYQSDGENDAGKTFRQLKLFKHGEGESKSLRLAKRRSVLQQDPPPTAEVLDRNNVHQMQFSIDRSGQLTDVTVYGSATMYYREWDLVGGWGANPTFTQADVAAHLSLSGADLANDAWYKTYCVDGADFYASLANQFALRRWVLNEDGSYTDGGTGQPAAVSVEDKINEAFGSGEASIVFDRKRRFLSNKGAYWPETVDRHVADAPYRVEISFDSGTTWMTVPNGYNVLEDECGIWLSVNDLARVHPQGIEAAQNNFVFAWLAGTLKVRIWAIVAGDDRLGAVRPKQTAGGGVNSLYRLRTIYRPEFIYFKGKLPGGSTIYTTDQSDAIGRFADNYLAANGIPRISGNPLIPWIETEYEIGDTIRGITGRDINFERTVQGLTTQPQIVGIIWNFQTQTTQLVLEDYALAPEDL